jgi:PAS domain-containing protein
MAYHRSKLLGDRKALMLKHDAARSSPAQLRTRAEARLSEGKAPATMGWPTGTTALTLLHKLASEPDSANDALKLLHELQVHQVELDLQHEQVVENSRQLTEDRDRYFELFDMAPLGYVTIDVEGRLLEANHLARIWLGLAAETPPACYLTDLLAANCRGVFRDALRRLRTGSSAETMTAQSKSSDDELFMRTTPASGGLFYLTAFMPPAPVFGH